MKEIALLIHEDVTLSTVTGAMDMMIHTNRLFSHSNKPLPFKIVIAGEKATDNLIQIQAPFVSYASLDEMTRPDLIIVPAFYGDRDENAEKTRTHH